MRNDKRNHAIGCLGGLLIATIASSAQAAQVETAYTTVSRYDIAGQLLGTISPDPDGAGPLHYAATRYTYGTGASTKPLLVKAESGELSTWANETVAPKDWSGFTVLITTQFTYDSYGRKDTERVIGTDGVVASLTQYSYDNRNRILCKTVRMNPATYASLPAACTPATEGDYGPDRITRYSYDWLDHVLTEERAVGTSLQQVYVTNTYAHRQLVSQTDANGNRTELRYDANARLKRRVYPSPNGPGAVNEGDYNEYDYDLNDNVVFERKRDGRTITNTYDANNRLTFKDLSDNTYSQDVSYNYDLRGLTLSTRFGSDSGEGITNTFDGFARLTATDKNVGGATRTLRYRYDANGNRTRITHPDNWYFAYGFDGIDRMNGLAESTSATSTAGTSSLLSVDYQVGGGRFHINRTGGSITEYLQDNVKRLDSFSQHFTSSGKDLLATFQYNPASQIVYRMRTNNLYELTGQVSRAGVYQPNGLNQYTAVGGRSLDYDSNGNLTNYRDADGQLVTYAYDMENHLVGVSGTINGQSVNASLMWDPLGRLHQVTVNGASVQALYDGDALVAEYSGGSLIRRYVHGDQVDEPLVQYDDANVGASYRRYLHADHQGSIIARSNNSGSALNINAYDPYGIPAATNTGRFGFTGQAWISELGLYHYKARMYHSRLGRFLQTDPIYYSDDMNMYAYVGGDPLNRADPMGLEGFVPWRLEGRLRTPAELESTGKMFIAWGTMWVAGIATAGSGAVATLSATKVGTGAAIGGIAAGVESSLRGNSTGQVLVDTLKGGVSSAATSAAGQLTEPATIPQTIGEASTAFVVSKELGDSDAKAGISAAVTGAVGLITNNPTAAASASSATSLARTIINQVVKTETKNELKAGACQPVAGSAGC